MFLHEGEYKGSLILDKTLLNDPNIPDEIKDKIRRARHERAIQQAIFRRNKNLVKNGYHPVSMKELQKKYEYGRNKEINPEKVDIQDPEAYEKWKETMLQHLNAMSTDNLINQINPSSLFGYSAGIFKPEEIERMVNSGKLSKEKAEELSKRYEILKNIDNNRLSGINSYNVGEAIRDGIVASEHEYEQTLSEPARKMMDYAFAGKSNISRIPSSIANAVDNSQFDINPLKFGKGMVDGSKFSNEVNPVFNKVEQVSEYLNPENIKKELSAGPSIFDIANLNLRNKSGSEHLGFYKDLDNPTISFKSLQNYTDDVKNLKLNKSDQIKASANMGNVEIMNPLNLALEYKIKNSQIGKALDIIKNDEVIDKNRDNYYDSLKANSNQEEFLKKVNQENPNANIMTPNEYIDYSKEHAKNSVPNFLTSKTGEKLDNVIKNGKIDYSEIKTGSSEENLETQANQRPKSLEQEIFEKRHKDSEKFELPDIEEIPKLDAKSRRIKQKMDHNILFSNPNILMGAALTGGLGLLGYTGSQIAGEIGDGLDNMSSMIESSFIKNEKKTLLNILEEFTNTDVFKKELINEFLNESSQILEEFDMGSISDAMDSANEYMSNMELGPSNNFGLDLSNPEDASFFEDYIEPALEMGGIGLAAHVAQNYLSHKAFAKNMEPIHVKKGDVIGEKNGEKIYAKSDMLIDPNNIHSNREKEIKDYLLYNGIGGAAKKLLNPNDNLIDELITDKEGTSSKTYQFIKGIRNTFTPEVGMLQDELGKALRDPEIQEIYKNLSPKEVVLVKNLLKGNFGKVATSKALEHSPNVQKIAQKFNIPLEDMVSKKDMLMRDALEKGYPKEAINDYLQSEIFDKYEQAYKQNDLGKIGVAMGNNLNAEAAKKLAEIGANQSQNTAEKMGRAIGTVGLTAAEPIAGSLTALKFGLTNEFDPEKNPRLWALQKYFNNTIVRDPAEESALKSKIIDPNSLEKKSSISPIDIFAMKYGGNILAGNAMDISNKYGSYAAFDTIKALNTLKAAQDAATGKLYARTGIINEPDKTRSGNIHYDSVDKIEKEILKNQRVQDYYSTDNNDIFAIASHNKNTTNNFKNTDYSEPENFKNSDGKLFLPYKANPFNDPRISNYNNYLSDEANKELLNTLDASYLKLIGKDDSDKVWSTYKVNHSLRRYNDKLANVYGDQEDFPDKSLNLRFDSQNLENDSAKIREKLLKDIDYNAKRYQQEFDKNVATAQQDYDETVAKHKKENKELLKSIFTGKINKPENSKNKEKHQEKHQEKK